MTQALLSEVGRQLLAYALPALATAIAGLLVGILTRYLKKVGLEVSEKQEARLTEITVQAINAVEERARRSAVQQATPATSGEKHATAFEIISAQVPGASSEQVQLSIDAQLPEQRAKTAPPIVMAAIQPKPSTPATFGKQP